MRYVTEVVFRSMLDNIDIVGRDYKSLSWSASQLRASSIWFFTEMNEMNVDIEKIIDKLGKF